MKINTIQFCAVFWVLVFGLGCGCSTLKNFSESSPTPSKVEIKTRVENIEKAIQVAKVQQDEAKVEQLETLKERLQEDVSPSPIEQTLNDISAAASVAAPGVPDVGLLALLAGGAANLIAGYKSFRWRQSAKVAESICQTLEQERFGEARKAIAKTVQDAGQSISIERILTPIRKKNEPKKANITARDNS